MALSQVGCTFFACSGGGPLRRDELGDWGGIPEGARPNAEEVQYLKDKREWRRGTFVTECRLAGDSRSFAFRIPGSLYNIPFTPAPGLEVRWRFPDWRRAVPSARHGVLWYGKKPVGDVPSPDYRDFCAAEGEWGCGMFVFGDWLAAGDTANAYDFSTGERVAAQKTSIALGYGLGYTRFRRVLPVSADGDLGLHALMDRRLGLSDVKYDLKDGTVLLFGALGWGRVNRRRYVQILWIPVPVGRVRL
jgi:hypothetical protein